MTEDRARPVQEILDATRKAAADGLDIIEKIHADHNLSMDRDDDGPKMRAWLARHATSAPAFAPLPLSDELVQWISYIVGWERAGRPLMASVGLVRLRERYESFNPFELPDDEQSWEAFVAKHVPLPAARIDELIGRMVLAGATIRCTSCGTKSKSCCGCGAPYVCNHRWVSKAEATPVEPVETALGRAMAAVKANPEKSNRAIAADLGISHTTIAKARNSLNNSGFRNLAPELPPELPPEFPPLTELNQDREQVMSTDASEAGSRPALPRSSEKRTPVDDAREIVRPLVAAGQSADPKTLAKKHAISHVTFEKAVAVERAVQRVHEEYRVDAVVRQHFATKGKPQPTSSNPVAEVNAFHQELVRFTADVSARLTEWMKSNPHLDADGKAALMQALYLCGDECAELAQKLDDR